MKIRLCKSGSRMQALTDAMVQTLRTMDSHHRTLLDHQNAMARSMMGMRKCLGILIKQFKRDRTYHYKTQCNIVTGLNELAKQQARIERKMSDLDRRLTAISEIIVAEHANHKKLIALFEEVRDGQEAKG